MVHLNGLFSFILPIHFVLIKMDTFEGFLMLLSIVYFRPNEKLFIVVINNTFIHLTSYKWNILKDKTKNCESAT